MRPDESDDIQHLGLALRLLGAAIAIGVVVWLVDVRTVIRSLSTLPIWLVGVGLLIYLARTWMMAVRWRWLTFGGEQRIGRWQFFRLTALRWPFNVALPSTVGGDLARSAYLLREADHHSAAHILGLFQNRIVGVVGIVVLGLATSVLLPPFDGRIEVQLILAGLFLGLGAFYWLLLAGPPRKLVDDLVAKWPGLQEYARPILEKLDQSRTFWRTNKQRLFGALAINLPIHLSLILFLYITSLTLGMELSFFALCPITCLVLLASGLPIPFGGIGVRELSFVFLLGRFGITPEAATALSLAQTGMYVLMGIVCAPLLSIGATTSPPNHGDDRAGPN